MCSFCWSPAGMRLTSPRVPRSSRAYFCSTAATTRGSRNTHAVEVGHVDGEERNTHPHNLMWTCRSCNVRCGVTPKRAGLGRRTRQYNPEGEGAKTLAQW